MTNLNDLTREYLLSSRLQKQHPSDFEQAIINAFANSITLQPLRAQHLAMILGINERTFNRCCNQFFGQNPSHLIRNIKAEIFDALLGLGYSERRAKALLCGKQEFSGIRVNTRV